MPGTRGDHAGERGDVGAHERLAAGQANLVYTHRRRGFDHGDDLFERQNLVARQPLHAFFRHAIHAAQIAEIGDGNTEIREAAAIAVDDALLAGNKAMTQQGDKWRNRRHERKCNGSRSEFNGMRRESAGSNSVRNE